MAGRIWKITEYLGQKLRAKGKLHSSFRVAPHITFVMCTQNFVMCLFISWTNLFSPEQSFIGKDTEFNYPAKVLDLCRACRWVISTELGPLYSPHPQCKAIVGLYSLFSTTLIHELRSAIYVLHLTWLCQQNWPSLG